MIADQDDPFGSSNSNPQTSGGKVIKLQVGDRVGMFHKSLCSGGNWPEYAIAWESMAFHLAGHVSFKDASQNLR